MISTEYNGMELLVCVASRYLEDGSSVSVGTGVPVAAAMLAQKLYAPNLLVIFEAGGIAPCCPPCPSPWVIPARSTKRSRPPQ